MCVPGDELSQKSPKKSEFIDIDRKQSNLPRLVFDQIMERRG
jgi:hypothetical protein